MPRVTQYIKNEDYDQWMALPNKSEFIHVALTNGVKNVQFIIEETHRAQFDEPTITPPEETA